MVDRVTCIDRERQAVAFATGAAAEHASRSATTWSAKAHVPAPRRPTAATTTASTARTATARAAAGPAKIAATRCPRAAATPLAEAPGPAYAKVDGNNAGGLSIVAR